MLCELVTKSCAFTITFGKRLTKLLTHHVQSAVKSQSNKKNFDFKILRKTLKRFVFLNVCGKGDFFLYSCIFMNKYFVAKFKK